MWYLALWGRLCEFSEARQQLSLKGIKFAGFPENKVGKGILGAEKKKSVVLGKLRMF